MSRIRSLVVVCAATALIHPVSLQAQGRDRFARALVDFSNALAGAQGDDGAVLAAALDAMQVGLEEWNAQVANVESRFAAEVTAAPAPAAARMRTALGTVYLERGRVQEALSQFDTASRLDPQFADVHLMQGLAHELSNRLPEAAAAYRSLWQKGGGNPAHAYLFLRFIPETESAEAAAAQQLLLMAVERVSRSDGGRLFVTMSLLDDESVPAPVFPPAAYSEAFSLLRAKRYDAAVAALRAIVASRPANDNERTRLAAADAFVASGDPVGGRAALLDIVAAAPKSGVALWKLGTLSQLMGDERGALRAFEAAAALPSLAGAGYVHAAIARLFHNQLDLDAAATAYARRVALTPNDSAAHYDLGEVYRAQGRLDVAMTEFLVAALLDPASARTFATVGQIHAAAGRDAAAVAMLRRAIDLDGAHLEARYALSRALLRLGRTEEAGHELAIFEQLQAKAMEDERRRFKDNQTKIEEALKLGAPAGPGR